MSDVLHHFFPKQQSAINNVQLLLWIETLFEIMDHTGLHILEEFLNPPRSYTLFSLNSSGSTLLWPHQACPEKHAWLWWEKAIKCMYCISSSTHLHQPLGDWYSSTFTTNWQWFWVVCPQTNSLYRQLSPSTNHCHQFIPFQVCRSYLLYSLMNPSNHLKYTSTSGHTTSKSGRRIYLN